ncbi:MAG: pyridoxine 5'-phosphate synthase [Acidobacteriota bacterium]
MTALSVNLNKVALLRNLRDLGLPDPLRFGRIAIAAGAAGLTVHPRPDRRHATPEDVRALRRLTRELGVELNVEGYPAAELLALVEETRPDQCTLVPDAPDQRTSDHGWDCVAHADLLRPVVERLRRHGIRVSLFVDPDPHQAIAARAVGADRVELYTEPYARAFVDHEHDQVLPRFRDTAHAAQQAGLGVNAGHDLNLGNLGAFLDAVPAVLEVSIGHALTAEALELGMAETVRRYVAICAARRG